MCPDGKPLPRETGHISGGREYLVTQLLQERTTADASGQRRAHAVVLELDDRADARVRAVWRALDRHGIPSAAHGPHGCSAPHVTLGIVDTDHPGHLHELLAEPLASAGPVPLPLTALGFFLTPRAPAYLAVAPTLELLTLHHRLHALIPASDSWAYYRPGSWTPHCTLAMDVSSPSLVAQAIGPETLPIAAFAQRARIVALPQPRRERRTMPLREPAAPA